MQVILSLLKYSKSLQFEYLFSRKYSLRIAFYYKQFAFNACIASFFEVRLDDLISRLMKCWMAACYI